MLNCLETLNSLDIVHQRLNVSSSQITADPYPELILSQDMGDTKKIPQASKILNDDSDAVVTIRSSFGYTGIVIIMIRLLHQYEQRVILEDFHGDDRKVYRLSDVKLDDDGVVDS